MEEDIAETGEAISKEELLRLYGLKNPIIGTIYKWMSSFGFKYNTIKKAYFVDGHEKPETVQYRKGYCQDYLHNKICWHCWAQFSLSEIKEIEKNDKAFARECAYTYIAKDTGVTMS